jgi:hypothetical protein
MNYTFEIVEGLENTSTEIPVTTKDAQKAYEICCGVNVPNLYGVNSINWVKRRNEFLSNVAFNGKHSHDCIILVLIWFKQFNHE